VEGVGKFKTRKIIQNYSQKKDTFIGKKYILMFSRACNSYEVIVL